MHKAHYVLMNIECDKETLTELEHAFKFNDAVLRHLIVAMTEAMVAPSPMMKEEKSRSLTDRETAREGDATAATGARRRRRGRRRRQRRRRPQQPRPRPSERRTAADVPGANRLTLDGTLAQRDDLRYTPAGIPALDCTLQHESMQVEAGGEAQGRVRDRMRWRSATWPGRSPRLPVG